MKNLGSSRKEYLRIFKCHPYFKSRDPYYLENQLLDEVAPTQSELQGYLTKFRRKLIEMFEVLRKNLSKEELEIIKILEENFLINAQKIYDYYDIRGRKIEDFAFYVLYQCFLNYCYKTMGEMSRLCSDKIKNDKMLDKITYLNLNELLQVLKFFLKCSEVLEIEYPQQFKSYKTKLYRKFFVSHLKMLKNFKEKIEIKAWIEIDPKLNKFRYDRLYTLFNPPSKKPLRFHEKRGAPTKFKLLRKSFANSIYIASFVLFGHISKEYFLRRKRALGLHAACFYLTIYLEIYKRIIQHLIFGDIALINLKETTPFPTNKTKFASFFRIDSKTLNKRLQELDEILEGRPSLWIEVVETFRKKSPKEFKKYLKKRFSD